MSTGGTGPAWQVREATRQRLLEGIKQKIARYADHFSGACLYNAILKLSQAQINRYYPWRTGHTYIPNMTDVPLEVRERIAIIFSEVLDEIRQFERSEEEGRALLAKLFEWVASEIARPYHTALQTQEMIEPRLIYGVDNRMEEIPIE